MAVTSKFKSPSAVCSGTGSQNSFQHFVVVKTVIVILILIVSILVIVILILI